MNSCKLSDRFIKKINEDFLSEVSPGVVLPETDDLLTKLLCKVNSVPVWQEYSKEEQENLSHIFLKKYAEDYDKSLLVNVIGLGIIQPILENSNVSEVLIDDGSSIKIVIGSNICDTEIYLSELQSTYLKKCALVFKDKTYIDDKFSAKIFTPSNNRIVIKKV